MQTVDEIELQAFLDEYVEWAEVDDALTAEFTFSDFKSAMSFVVRVSFEAEAAGHHPDMFISYNRVSLRLSTHDAGNQITEKDLSLAKRIESILN